MSNFNKIVLETGGMNALSVSDVGGRLQAWEFKSGNMHRGILAYQPIRDQTTCDVKKLIRAAVLDLYKPSWNRGFAFGAMVEFETADCNRFADFDTAIDAFNNSRGVWQWIIALDRRTKFAHAHHMWMKGSLHEHFEKTVERLSTDGFSVMTTYAERPAFFTGLGTVLAALSSKIVPYLVFAIVGLIVISMWLIVHFMK
jgi:hypothetical protein